MAVSPASIAASAYLPGHLSACSLSLGWEALLRRFDEPREAEFETRPTADQLIVLVRGGSCTVESWSGRRWRSARYRPGDLGLTAPGEGNRLRFHGATSHQTLHLHIPAPLLVEAGELLGRPIPTFDGLRARHDLTAAVMTALDTALETGAPAIHAEAAVRYLVMQMVCDANTLARPTAPCSRSLRERVDGYMRENLGRAITLEDIAAAAGMSVFQLIRYSKATWGLTPAARLTKLRMERAQHLLRTTRAAVTSIALECGYGNPSHFATAFRRQHGSPPNRYRASTRE